MCGIFLELLDEGEESVLWPRIRSQISARGPDHLETKEISIGDGKKVFLASSVLWLQGPNLSVQPKSCEGGQGGFLLWNGDVFAGDLSTDGSALSDTDSVFSALERSEADLVPSVVSLVRGPFAFAYLRRGRVWFGRDVLGRHCLLVGRKKSGRGFFLSSVAHGGLGEEDCVEVPAMGVFEEDLLAPDGAELVLHPWERSEEVTIGEDWWSSGLKWITSEVPLRRPIDLPVLDEEEDVAWDSVVVRAVEEKWTAQKAIDAYVKKAAEGRVRDLTAALEKSVRTRVTKMPGYCKDCLKARLRGGAAGVTCPHSKVSVLFSGGLDSTVLAALADRALADPREPLDLVNVAFQMEDGSFDVPDRVTARQGYEELLSVSTTGRPIRLVEVDVTRSELSLSRSEAISALLHPSALTVLDDGIGCALWFAARGRGTISGRPYDSPARVLLVGTGADEQFGGYTRHRARFKESGLSAVTSELRLELGRIWRRNLGRDNRVISSHGVAPRYPYLDEDVVNLVSSIPTSSKLDLRLPRGAGEKLLLRAVAAGSLGLERSAKEPKRAIQFGSRIANRREKGHQAVADREGSE